MLDLIMLTYFRPAELSFEFVNAIMISCIAVFSTLLSG